MKRRLQIAFLFMLAISINVFAEISAQQPLPKGQAPKSIQEEDRAKFGSSWQFDKRFSKANPELVEKIVREGKVNPQDIEAANFEYLAQANADDKKDVVPPKADVHGRGLVKPADLDKRIAASWLKHGKKLTALPHVTATSFDCRDMGWVPPFDDQGSCGDCWVFSGVDPCCAALYKAGKLKSPQTLSKQMALDCYFRDACGGGWPEDAINAVKASGVATDQDYPTAYHANPGSCKTVDSSKIYKVLQSGYVAQGGNATYQQCKDAMVRYGVLSICYDANDTPTGPPDKAKVWKGSGGRSIDHAIKVIAFDDSLSPKGGILCWNQWYGDNRDLWWAEWGANGLGDSLMFVDAGDAPIPPVPPVPPSPDGAPTITSPLAVVAQAGQPFTYQITATNDPKIFYALPAVEGITVNAVTGQVTGTPTAIGTITVNLVAGNTKGAGQATLTITVGNAPVPPVPPNPTDGFTGSVTTTYKNGVIVSVTVGGAGSLESDLKNAGVSPTIIADVLKLFADLIGKQPTNILIGDVLKIFTDLVASDPEYKSMPKGTP